MGWKERISRILALGMYDWMCDTDCSWRNYEIERDLLEIAYDAGIESDGLKCACASDPTYYFRCCVLYKKWLTHIKKRPIFYISGQGLSCEDLDGNSFAVASEIDNIENLKENDFIVLQTDRNYYSECVAYDYIARQFVMPIKMHYTIDVIIRMMKKMEDQCHVHLEKYQKKLKEQFNKSKTLYPNQELVLVRWFRDGRLRWEFHPLENIKYKINKI